jgi:uncharacterized protein (DUF4415 family)
MAEDMRLFKPIADADLGMVEAIAEFRRKLGRLKAEAPKIHIGFRLASDVVASIRARGPGYNTVLSKRCARQGLAKRSSANRL